MLLYLKENKYIAADYEPKKQEYIPKVKTIQKQAAEKKTISKTEAKVGATEEKKSIGPGHETHPVHKHEKGEQK